MFKKFSLLFHDIILDAKLILLKIISIKDVFNVRNLLWVVNETDN